MAPDLNARQERAAHQIFGKRTGFRRSCEAGAMGYRCIGRRDAGWLLAALAAAGFLHFLGAAPIVHAHGGLDAGQNPLFVWNTNPLPTLGLFLAAYLYVTGLSRWQRPSHPVTFWQRASFFAGLLALFLALQSPIEPLAEHMLSFHQIQHLLLRMIGPLLVLLGAPLTPMLRGLPPWALHRVVKPIVRKPLVRQGYEYLTNPVVATVLFLSILYLWQVPANMDLALRNDIVHEFMHFTMLFTGFLFYWIVVDPKPHRSRLHYGLRVLYLGLIVIPNTLLGVAIVFAEGPLYSAYTEVGRPFNMSLMDDQQLGGLLLWVPGDMMSILAAGIVMVMWYQKEEEQDRALAAKHRAGG